MLEKQIQIKPMEVKITAENQERLADLTICQVFWTNFNP